MSLILEALRKSEAERRRGQAPGLHAELPPVAPVDRRAVPRAIWIAAVALSALAAAAWIASRQDGPVGGTPRTAVPPTPIATTSPERRDDAGVAAYPAVDRIPPPEPNRQPQPAPSTPGAGHDTLPAPARDAEDAVVTPRAPAPAPGTAPVEPVRPAEPRAAPATRADLPSGTGTGLPTVAELPAAERNQLPELKLTMHMWNERPAQRFVILDGVRHAEGERVGAATIRAIDAEGVVLDLNGRAVRLPLR